MALRIYKPNTLNGNWSEDRAKPLKGVLADYGHKEFKSQAQASFGPEGRYGEPPPKCGDPNGRSKPQHLKFASVGPGYRGAAKPVFSMTRPETWEDAMVERESAATGDHFLSVVPHLRKGDDNPSSQWRSTSQIAFGVGDGFEAKAAQSRFLHSTEAPFVVGRSGSRVEKGKGCAEAPGMDKVPHSWSWLYGETPDSTSSREAERQPNPAFGASASLAGCGESATTGSFDPLERHGRVAALTKFSDPKAAPQKGVSVFKDEAESTPLSW